MAKRKEPKASDNRLSEFVVDVASGDMPTETVIRADKRKNPRRTRFAGWEKSKARRLSLHGRRKRQKPQGRNLTGRRFPVGQTAPANRAAIREQTCPTLRVLPQSWGSAQKVLQGFVGRRHPLLVWILLFHVCGQDPAARATFNEHAGLSTLAPHRSPHAGCCCSPKGSGLLWLSTQVLAKVQDPTLAGAFPGAGESPPTSHRPNRFRNI